MTDTNTQDREVIITRTFDAPRELVFEAFIDPKHISNWWGPNGFKTTTHEMDVTVGGVWRHTMVGPDGTEFPNRVEYQEITPPERLAYKNGTPDDPDMFQARVTFEDHDGKTTVTMHTIFRTKEERDMVVEKYGAIEGGHQTLARLAEHLEQMQK